LTGYVPKEMSSSDISQVINSFGEAARRAKQAGYELIEVIGSTGYLISQFLSPLTNLRTDEYGGSYTNRMRFGLKVIEAVRSQVGPDFPISVRLGGSDFVSGGNTLKEIAEFARELEKASVNLINITGGWHESTIPQISHEVPVGAYSYLAHGIKSAVNIPVAASNRINDPQVAEEIISTGQADLVSVARGFLADPSWGNKAQAGETTLIRKCIACMNCLDRLFSGQDVLCAINPQCGRETEMTITPANDPKKVVVIGAGPAGLEAARVAAEKGHMVSLWEKEDKIGGQWNLAAIPPGKEEFRSLLDYYQAVLEELDVDIKLNTTATADTVKSVFPDAVIVATGAQPSPAEITIVGQPLVMGAEDVLKGQPVVGPDIVIIGGGTVGCETAVFLAEKGTVNAAALKFMILHHSEEPQTIYDLLTRSHYSVKVVETSKHVAGDMGKATRWALMKQIRMRGIEIITGCKVDEINSLGIKMINNAGEVTDLKADTVVVAAGSHPNNHLYQELKNDLPEVYLTGDAVNPGHLMAAIHQAFAIARQI
jgi:2,4-dienoyl-CoA reductase (NADPH2)